MFPEIHFDKDKTKNKMAPSEHLSTPADEPPPDSAQQPPECLFNFIMPRSRGSFKKLIFDKCKQADRCTLTQVFFSSTASCLSATTSSDNTVAA